MVSMILSGRSPTKEGTNIEQTIEKPETVQEKEKIRWPLAIGAGSIAGIIFMGLEMILVQIFRGESLWGPPRMIAAILLGKSVLTSTASFNLAVFITTLALHFVLSIVYALILAWIVHSLDATRGILVGAGFGLLLYFINFYGFTALFPWFAMARNPITIFTHIVFGIVVAWVYKFLPTLKIRRV